jgi:hypothetical protein
VSCMIVTRAAVTLLHASAFPSFNLYYLHKIFTMLVSLLPQNSIPGVRKGVSRARTESSQNNHSPLCGLAE